MQSEGGQGGLPPLSSPAYLRLRQGPSPRCFLATASGVGLCVAGDHVWEV